MKFSAYVLVLFFSIGAYAVKSTVTGIPEGSRVYVAPMNGFETYVVAALHDKKVPVVVVGGPSSADFIISGVSESQKASAMRVFVSGNWRSDEKASITVRNLHTDEIVYAYSVNKWSSWHGTQSTAEACAKHLKEGIVRLSPEEFAAFELSSRVDAQPVSQAPNGVTAPPASTPPIADSNIPSAVPVVRETVDSQQSESLGDAARKIKEQKQRN